jgi:hypothetical protein
MLAKVSRLRPTIRLAVAASGRLIFTSDPLGGLPIHATPAVQGGW